MAVKDLTSRLKKNTHSMTQNTTQKPDDKIAPALVHVEESKAKKKVGRPKIKDGDYKTINIAVPIDMLKKMEVAKLKYGNNLTAYVNAVIKADLDANYEKYLHLQELLNN